MKSMDDSIDEFLSDYPGMSRAPSLSDDICLRGKFRFKASVCGDNDIQDDYRLEIKFSSRFPRNIPVVREVGDKIPRNGDYHVNGDGSLCLGSPLRLLLKIRKNPGVGGFVDSCLIPYLYAVSHKLKYGGEFVFGELKHQQPGMIEDYIDILGLHDEAGIREAVSLLAIKKRIANKKTCPCGCGKRLGVCPFHHKLNELRKAAPVSWFRQHAKMLVE
tara:strand:- start:84 stop:734 length:651 start_codon:yes stop_codon:yes gene_type:complete